jgi:mono/diheme cytochrome c family protein
MNKRLSRVAFLSTVTASLMLATCASRPSVQQQSPSSPPETVVWSQNGWSDAERTQYHHLAEGSEIMPYVLLANVVSLKTGKPFLENMERFGFIPDVMSTANPHGLPVGLTTVHSRDESHTGLEMVGFNCAACHVAEVSYQGKTLLIDGAPSLVDLQAYQVEFKDSLEATLRDPAKGYALVIAMDRDLRAGDTPPIEDVSTYASDSAARTAGDVAAASTADENFHSMSSRTADATDSAAALLGQTSAARFQRYLELLKARLAYLKNEKLLTGGTEPGPGRIDAFGAARNLLFPKDAVPMRSPVSFPFIWDVPDSTQQRSGTGTLWIHYDGNTNSILERNIGQALGMGTVYDPRTYESTLRIANLHQLEVLIHKLKAPKWPAEIFGPIDETKAKAGEQIFKETCRDCHQNDLHALTEVGTDPERANSFGRPVAGGVPFPAAIKPILDGLKARAFSDDRISTVDQASMDSNPVIWRATGQYLARPLTGVWATAPYLHNGSVPTLWHLLHPTERPAKFIVGNREYDPSKLGYSSGGKGWIFDTSQPGNSNIGHTGDKYGTNLTEDQKAVLLEYLKTI